jgi:hypothetical protein
MNKRGWIAIAVALAAIGMGTFIVVENRRTRAIFEEADELLADNRRLLACMEGGTSEQSDREPSPSELNMARTLVGEGLREPESARFSKISVVTKNCTPVVCGLVNARNGFGGMTGDRSFAVAGGTAYFADAGSYDAKTIQMFCEM